jgi:hypothetical protein
MPPSPALFARLKAVRFHGAARVSITGLGSASVVAHPLRLHGVISERWIIIHQTARPWKGMASSRAEKSIEPNGFSSCGASSGRNMNLSRTHISLDQIKKAALARCLLSNLLN